MGETSGKGFVQGALQGAMGLMNSFYRSGEPDEAQFGSEGQDVEKPTPNAHNRQKDAEELEKPLIQRTAGQKPTITANDVQKFQIKINDLKNQVVGYQAAYENSQFTQNKLNEANAELIKQNKSIQEDNHYVGWRYQYIIDKILQPYARSLGTNYNDRNADTINATIIPMNKDALDARSLRNQVQSLQQEMLAKIEKVQAVTDDQFAQHFRTLAAAVKALSRKTQLIKGANIFELLAHSVDHEFLPQDRFNECKKKCFLEVCLWSVLLAKIFSRPLRVFGKRFKVLDNNWFYLFGSGEDYRWPSPTSASETWRYTTMQRLTELAGTSVISASGRSEVNQHDKVTVRQAVEDGFLRTRVDVFNIIFDKLKPVSSNVDIEQIYLMIDKAIILATQMSLQRARLQITYPEIGARFTKQMMSCVPNDNDDEIEDGVVAYVLNPGLTKWGDALGKNLNVRYDIVPSLVQLQPMPGQPSQAESLI